MSDKMQGREVIFELRPVGGIMRVTAMDTASMTEVIVQCPLSAGEAAFKKNALMRLEYVLKKKGIIAQ
jgi:hypothetical protein